MTAPPTVIAYYPVVCANRFRIKIFAKSELHIRAKSHPLWKAVFGEEKRGNEGAVLSRTSTAGYMEIRPIPHQEPKLVDWRKEWTQLKNAFERLNDPYLVAECGRNQTGAEIWDIKYQNEQQRATG
jgi:hypothetical protein